MKYPGKESSVLELKKEVPKKDQIVKTVVGFCNQSGGKLVLGVDDRGTVVGIDASEIEKLLEFLDKMIYEATSPPIIPLISAERYGTKTLLVIKIPNGMNKPYFRKSEGLERGTYIRLGRSNLRATADMIEELRWNSRGRAFDLMPITYAKMEDLDTTKIKNFLDSRKEEKKAELTQELMKSYFLCVEEYSFLHPTHGGILLFGKNPQFYISEAFIICTHFEGIEGRKALATKDCVGTLFDQFEEAYNWVLSRLNRSFEIKGPRRSEKFEIPTEAFREILLNAIIHRNYHINGPTKIAIYDNRIEIFSPGVFPGPIDLENLNLGITYIRNLCLTKIFREYGYIEKLGTGFLTLFRSYEKYNLPKPQVIEGENFVKCILPRPVAYKTTTVPHKSNDCEKILKLFDTTEEIAISDVIDNLQFSRSTAGRYLAKLVQENKIEKIGQKKSVKYRKSQ